MTLETMLSELQYTNDIEQAVLQKIRKDERSIDEITKTAYHGENLSFALCKRMPLTRLSVVTYLFDMGAHIRLCRMKERIFMVFSPPPAGRKP